MNATEKQEILAKIAELKNYLRDSLPLRANGGGHIHNELIKLEAKVEKIAAV